MLTIGSLGIKRSCKILLLALVMLLFRSHFCLRIQNPHFIFQSTTQVLNSEKSQGLILVLDIAVLTKIRYPRQLYSLSVMEK